MSRINYCVNASCTDDWTTVMSVFPVQIGMESSVDDVVSTYLDGTISSSQACIWLIQIFRNLQSSASMLTKMNDSCGHAIEKNHLISLKVSYAWSRLIAAITRLIVMFVVFQSIRNPTSRLWFRRAYCMQSTYINSHIRHFSQFKRFIFPRIASSSPLQRQG